MKSSKFHKLVRKNGWVLMRAEGSRYIYKNGNRIYPVPWHGAREIGTGLERKMKREMDLK